MAASITGRSDRSQVLVERTGVHFISRFQLLLFQKQSTVQQDVENSAVLPERVEYETPF